MKLIDGWREELNRAWSVRLAIFTSILASSDQLLSAFVGTIPPLYFGALSLAVILAKVLWQK